jgi:hypothetical protein
MGLAVMALVLAGCSSQTQTASAEKVLRERIESESSGQIKLVSFKKTDGQAIEAFGVKGYKMDYEAEIEFQTDGTWQHGGIYTKTGGLAFGFATGQPPKEGSWAAFANTSEGVNNVHRGDRAKIAGVMQGEKKESGWRFESSESHIVSGPTPGGNAFHSASIKPNEALRAQVMKELRNIDGAKQQWALQNNKGMNVVPSEADLRPYLGTGKEGAFPVHPPGGRYIINAINRLPESTTYGVLVLTPE